MCRGLVCVLLLQQHIPGSFLFRYGDPVRTIFRKYGEGSYRALLFDPTIIMSNQVDKFCLMRIWANSPHIGSEVARFSRKYFFSAAVVAYAVISSYQWAGFPYDNLCRSGKEDYNPITGASRTYSNVVLLNGNVLPSVTVRSDEYFQYCRQSWRGFEHLPFPPTPRQQGDQHWMTPSQEKLTRLYGNTAVFFLSGYLLYFFGAAAAGYFLSWFRGVTNPKGMSAEASV